MMSRVFKMKLSFLTVFVYAGYMAVCVAALDTSARQDSYTDALQNSHNTNQFDNNGEGYYYNPPTDNSYLPPTSAPPPVYGPPPIPFYNPPPPVFYKPHHPIPHHLHDSFWEKLKSKINLFTIGKIVLKLLILKKIFKFIGIICLLLFLPKLKNLVGDKMSSEEDEMSSKHEPTDKDKLQQQLDDMYDFVMNSIQGFE